MNQLLTDLLPELILVSVACVLFLLGATRSTVARQATPWLALAGLGAAGWIALQRMLLVSAPADLRSTIVVSEFAGFIQLTTLVVGGLLVLVNWPTNAHASGNAALALEKEGPEYFGLMLLSLTGVLLVTCANDLILLFLGFELASIPTYIMLSISRPIASAQEAALKYFFLGAFSAALMLFGLSFLFGTAGSLNLSVITEAVAGQTLAVSSGWMILAGLMIVLGLAFKLAAFPLHFYAPDVYTGAATPLTALLSFVPKAAGLVALIKVLFVLQGGTLGTLPPVIVTVLWTIAVMTMTVGNLLGLVQHNVKRMMACSSIAHSGYMLAAVLVAFSAINATGQVDVVTRSSAMQGVMFYLAAYGLMNVGVFAVLTMLPAKSDPFVHDGQIPPATTAETFTDLAGTGRHHAGLGLIMAICCFSLIGIPLTIGFFGKLFLIRPLLSADRVGLAIVLVVNAAISAGYYLRIVATMFLKETRPAEEACAAGQCQPGVCLVTIPLLLAGILSAGGSVLLGTFTPTTTMLRTLTVNNSSVGPAYPVAPAIEPTPEQLPAAK